MNGVKTSGADGIGASIVRESSGCAAIARHRIPIAREKSVDTF